MNREDQIPSRSERLRLIAKSLLLEDSKPIWKSNIYAIERIAWELEAPADQSLVPAEKVPALDWTLRPEALAKWRGTEA